MIIKLSTSVKIIVDIILVGRCWEIGYREEQQLFDVENNDSISSVSFQDSQ